MVISHTLLAAWDAIISPTEIESIRQILHALHKTIISTFLLICISISCCLLLGYIVYYQYYPGSTLYEELIVSLGFVLQIIFLVNIVLLGLFVISFCLEKFTSKKISTNIFKNVRTIAILTLFVNFAVSWYLILS